MLGSETLKRDMLWAWPNLHELSLRVSLDKDEVRAARIHLQLAKHSSKITRNSTNLGNLGYFKCLGISKQFSIICGCSQHLALDPSQVIMGLGHSTARFFVTAARCPKC